ncbi:hypothetical protein AbraIFM66951_012053 [Aspergillus brasiliensis]|uniref:Cytochrome P450 n=1 Tax=Aspergillus brasiliensis TaxID=319629 RepID=A0A9W6DRU7_9EURO|nr:hypothetical protein AbraCBS73388_002877 [Aspergillus brasiliensis]GKZ48289.1 hypothetical protein AbraIFM66951_012053 [Aspergillus brasiliensis]
MGCTVRVCRAHCTIKKQKFTPGDIVIKFLGPARRDPISIPGPETFKLNRPSNAYIHFDCGALECIGKEIALTFSVSMLHVLAGLKYRRPAPVVEDLGSDYMRNSFNGYGQGAYKTPTPPPLAPAFPSINQNDEDDDEDEDGVDDTIYTAIPIPMAHGDGILANEYTN